MKRLAILLSSLMLTAQSATLCVGPSATGGGTGADWDNRLAWTATPTRGDTWYLADGSYAAKNLNVAVSGTTLITIKKATASDHVTDTGWTSELGDGTAIIAANLTISTSYWFIDGQTGTLDGTFGIQVKRTASDGYCISGTDGTGHITLRYVELENAGYSSADYGNADCLHVYGNSSGCDSWSLYRCWLHSANRTGNWLYGCSNFDYDECWFSEIISMDEYGVHGEAFSINLSPNSGTNTIRNCVFRNNEGTAVIGFMNSFGDHSNFNWDIFNNVFYVDADHILDGWDGVSTEPSESDFTGSNAIIDILSSATAQRIYVIGNTFANAQQTSGVTLEAGGTGNIVENNLWISGTYTGTFTGNTAENNTSTTDTSYAVAYATHDYRLAKATAAGTTQSAPFNTDKAGAARGADGTWDIGAYEYNSSPPGPVVLRANAVTVRGTVSTR